MAWYHAFERVRPYVVRLTINLDGGRQQVGTGFLLDYGQRGRVAAVATAFHVIQPAQEAGQGVVLWHETSGRTATLALTRDTVRFDEGRDCATLLVPADALDFPREPLPRTPTDQHRAPGFPVAWMGFPEPTYEMLCFFAGHISCHLTGTGYYAIDGAAMHGLSGGPLFTEFQGETFLLGTILSYGPEREPVNGLPGFTAAHDLSISCRHLAEIG
jgi:hypothetical protein